MSIQTRLQADIQPALGIDPSIIEASYLKTAHKRALPIVPE